MKYSIKFLAFLAIVSCNFFFAAPAAEAKDTTHNKPKTFLRSHSKQIGTIGRYQVHQIKVRGLDTPNVAAAVIYDPATEQLLVVGPGVAPGLGAALVNSAGNAGAAALFGQSLRPSRHTISNGNSSSVSNPEATVTNTSNSVPGDAFVPPGHINNPSQNK